MDGGATPAGLGARDTLRLEVCFHLYGNDLMEERGPIEAGLGWCCKEDTGFIGVRRRARGARGRSGRDARAVHDDRPGHRPPGQPGRGRRRGHLRHDVARAWASGSAWPTCRPRAPSPAPPIEIDVRGKLRAAEVRNQAAVLQGALNVADASYPDDLRYHPEHDWARIDGDVATFGITWYAQDQLGEVVFVDPPEVGKTMSKDEPYAEIESVKAVSDVVAPLSGEIVEVNEALGDAPEKINDDPYGDGWLVKVRLDRSVRGRGAAGPRGLRGQPRLEPLHLRHRRRPGGDARGHRRRLGRRAVRRHPRERPARPGDRPAAGQAGAGGVRVPARPRARATSRPRTRSRSSAPGCTTTTCRR